jgi:hypothetical protein
MALPEGFVLEQGASNLPQGFVAEQPPQGRSLVDELGRQVGLTARAGYEAFTAPATAVLEAGRTAYNLGAEALGAESRLPSFYTEQQKALTGVGLPEPEGRLERAVNLGTQSMVSTGAAAKALPSIPAFAADLARQIPAAGVAGLVSQPVAEIVKDFTGSDLAALIASAGVGAGAAAGTGKAISASAPIVDRFATKAYNLGAEKIGSSARKELAYPEVFTMDQIKQRASKSYQAMDEAGVVLKPESTKQMLTDIRQGLNEARMVKGTDQAKEMNARIAQVQSMIDKNGVSFTALEKMRGIFNDLKSNKDGDLRRLGGIAVNKVDDYISNVTGKDLIAGQGGIDKAVQSVMSARKDWRNASRASILDDALNVAEARALDPKASESELIRRGFINIAADKTKMKSFTKQEQNLIRSVAEGGLLDPLLSSLSRFSPLRSQLVTAGAIPAYTQMPTTTLAVLGGGLAADVGQGLLRSRAAQQAVRQIASGAVPTPQPNLAYRGLLSSPAIDLNSLREPQ